ncbi:MAG: TetR/AcrR family transcriptional regulator [Verrucomicrobiales bacterium]
MTDSVLTRKDRDRKIREDDFLAAAEQLFAQNGFHHTSMEDIAATAQYATGTIYRYFDSKQALYFRILEMRLEEHLEGLKSAIAQQSTALDQLRTLMRAKFRFFQDHQDFLAIYLGEFSTPNSCMVEPTAGLPPRCVELVQGCQAMLESALRHGMQTGEFHPYHVGTVMAMIRGLTDGLLLNAWETTRYTELEPPENLVHTAIKFMEAGLTRQP